MLTQLVSKITTPLCLIPDGKLVCYQKGDIVVYDDGAEISRLPLFGSFTERLLGRIKPIARLMRLGVRSAVAIDDDNVILSTRNRLLEQNLNTGVLSEGYDCGDGVRPLMFASVQGINGIDDGIYFGGYLKNDYKSPVHIYKRTDIDKWEIVYSFEDGAINHVHAIVPDKFRKCLWILTGDFDDAAAIWKVTNGFKKIERVACGNQKWRGCVAFALPEGLLYATDSPFTDNHIYLIKDDGSVVLVGDLSGSCIYGCKWRNKYVFSSTVEADGRDETMWRLFTSKKRGAGIKDEYVRMYVGNLTEGFKEVYKEKKDGLPFIFQFGVFKFPSGDNYNDTLYFQPVATNKNDLRLMRLKEDIVL